MLWQFTKYVVFQPITQKLYPSLENNKNKITNSGKGVTNNSFTTKYKANTI